MLTTALIVTELKVPYKRAIRLFANIEHKIAHKKSQIDNLLWNELARSHVKGWSSSVTINSALATSATGVMTIHPNHFQLNAFTSYIFESKRGSHFYLAECDERNIDWNP